MAVDQRHPDDEEGNGHVRDSDLPSVEDIDAWMLEGRRVVPRVMAPVRWYGGKGNLATWIVPMLPRLGVQRYIEPYCGAASVFWHLDEPYPVEVLNDLDERIVTLFRVLQDRTMFAELAHRIIYTPYARAEFTRALDILKSWDAHDPVTRAWATFTAQNQGFSGVAVTPGHWGKVLIPNNLPTTTWQQRLLRLRWWHLRLARVQIDCRDALEVIRYWDDPEALFYLDPPYVSETRVRGERSIYRHEADDAHHRALLDVLCGVRGRAVVSGYASALYDEALTADRGWARHERRTTCYAAARVRGSKLRGAGSVTQHASRTEVLWCKL